MACISTLLASSSSSLWLNLLLASLFPQTLRKKGFSGCDSPEPDGEDSIDQSPLNDDKYRKTTEDMDILFKRYGVGPCPPAPGLKGPLFYLQVLLV